MQDFNEYSKRKQNSKNNSEHGGIDNNLFNLVNSLANRFDGKSQTELMRAIYEEAKKGKKNGTLTNAEIDNFSAMLMPLLDEKQRKTLRKVADELKRI